MFKVGTIPLTSLLPPSSPPRPSPPPPPPPSFSLFCFYLNFFLKNSVQHSSRYSGDFNQSVVILYFPLNPVDLGEWECWYNMCRARRKTLQRMMTIFMTILFEMHCYHLQLKIYIYYFYKSFLWAPCIFQGYHGRCIFFFTI